MANNAISLPNDKRFDLVTCDAAGSYHVVAGNLFASDAFFKYVAEISSVDAKEGETTVIILTDKDDVVHVMWRYGQGLCVLNTIALH